ncbi:hypothetical protein A2954_04490 [Candidatus Roizmanbacteria bacterium RIFCSPLOWO2_01_FULL_37_12]|uniref:Uncharacterized protein n=1 Tax=Candidatus Roizmanbacteria bacterium RIFCSPLOWO2_01_FULL_37_12 TaxID=1802056 RepID=A0A1F7IFY2_9BACT|nr:MAG: hypothetical protein A3D76_06430 [Candidatus Roizmanbacteria bacterium RIFCSPHIGHO2_02_FULL_37_9b]OGK42240.1 MAG: hypothetical protein A2954_04490 [Candidatus Roizmanbacteria bacterium RIFCSPLOWO2_01_FULL_37_12]
MSLRKKFTSVTPFSKALAMILFIILPIGAFFLGINYEKNLNLIKSGNQIGDSNPIEYKIIEVFPTEGPRDLIDRCGKIPSEKLGNPKKNHYTIVSDPVWSPDCRYIAWSVFQSGTSIPDTNSNEISYQGPYPQEGVFLYTDRTGDVIKISDNGIFKNWNGSKKFIYLENNEEKKFEINSGSILNN